MDIRTLLQAHADKRRANEALLKATERAGRDLTDAEAKTIDANIAEMQRLSAHIERIRGQRAEEANAVRFAVRPENNPGGAGSVEVLDAPKFKTLGEQLQAVVTFERSHGANRDPRLIAVGSQEHRVMAAAAGMNEAVPSEGGFLVQSDLAEGLLQRVYDSGEILKLCQTIEVSSNSNKLIINGIDESNRANGSRFGGVQAFWANEAQAVTATKPKFRRVEMTLNKLMAICYATDEMVSDAAVMDSVINTVFPQEMAFRAEDAVFNGLGGGQPLGFLVSPALIVVNKEAAQAANTVVAQNIMKMWSSCWGRSRKNAVWCIDQSIEPQLFQMTLPSAAGISVPIYLPPGGLSASPYGTLFGRPVIPTEYNAALSSQGDIILADFSQIALARKGAIQAASSMHVNFTTDEMAFRFTWRLDAQSTWNTTLTPKNQGNALSPFVTLQAR